MEYSRSLHNKKVLITCGPTWVRLDTVRVLSNISSGELAHLIAKDLTKEQARITLLEGPVTHPFSHPSVKVIKFHYFEELSAQLAHELKKNHYDLVIHAAAVSDYKPKKESKRKISSHQKNLCLCLTPTPKLISKIKKIDPNIFLVGFKLETDIAPKALRRKAQRLAREAHCDLVVANAFNKKKYTACIIDGQGQLLAKAKTKQKLSTQLIKTLKERL